MSKMPILERENNWFPEAGAPPRAAVSFLGIESDAERAKEAAATAENEHPEDYGALPATIRTPHEEGRAAVVLGRQWFERASGEVAALYRLYDYACEVERADEVLGNRYTYPVEERPAEERVKMAENVKAFAERGFTLVLQELRAGGVPARQVTSDYLPFSGRTSCGAAAVGLRRDDERPSHHDTECLNFWARRYAWFLAGLGVSLVVMGMMMGTILSRDSSGARPRAVIRYEGGGLSPPAGAFSPGTPPAEGDASSEIKENEKSVTEAKEKVSKEAMVKKEKRRAKPRVR